MTAIVIWAVTAWFFGIPTSESHALISGLSGASVALNKNIGAINLNEITKVISGLLLSSLIGFLSGFLTVKIIKYFIKNADREKTDRKFIFLQKISAAFMAFMHGAQDGQKFIGVILISTGFRTAGENKAPLWTIIFCSLLMSAGTSMGGMRIIRTMGNDMIRLKKYQGFSADFAGAFSLLSATLFGIPVSTTHTKTCAIMGAGTSDGLKKINPKVIKEMILAWVFTFPACGFLGYLMTIIFMKIR